MRRTRSPRRRRKADLARPAAQRTPPTSEKGGKATSGSKGPSKFSESGVVEPALRHIANLGAVQSDDERREKRHVPSKTLFEPSLLSRGTPNDPTVALEGHEFFFD